MVSTTAPVLILKYTRGVLAADSVLAAMDPAPSINVVPVPPTATFPRVVIESPSSAPNVNALQDGFARIASQPRVQISYISANENIDQIDAIAARAETLLDGQGSIDTDDGGEVISYSQDWSTYGPSLEQYQNRATIIQQYSTQVRAG